VLLQSLGIELEDLRETEGEHHLWRGMAHRGMTLHISGSSLSAKTRYAAGTREILESYFAGTPIRGESLIVEGGELAGTGARSYTANTQRS
jgi:formate dehydrogenase